MKIPSPYENYPPRWNVFDKYVRNVGAEGMSFSGNAADVNRFAARYRAARCFKRVEFEGLTAGTAEGYSALSQLLLTYSAFEHFLHCIGVELRNTSYLLNDAQRTRILAALRNLNGQSDFFVFLKPHLNQSFQRQIDNHLSGQSCNPFYLAGGIRHAFAHGVLTATPVNVPSQSVATVSRFLCRVLFKVMDSEFEQRMIDFEDEIYS